ncbi:hypothetical protein ACH40F_43785 [Streptomyces sp. NPDC020794]|uniref:hypothetical protein n=1 Tax=unclassified Streptomyces TaxID=2593676 RepID=UPI0036E4A892
MRTRLLAAVAAVSLALISLGTASATAQAETGSISCRGGDLNLRYSPGITLTKGAVLLSGYGSMGVCTSVKYPRITGGVVRVEASLEAECLGGIGPGQAKVTIAWNDGSKSVINQSAIRGTIESFILEGGSVASGRFLGGTTHASGRTTTDPVALSADCALGGLTSYHSTIDQFTIAS